MPRTAPWLRSLLEEHLEEVQTLWERRTCALRDADYHWRDVAELDERLEAHVDGLVLGAEYSLPLLVAGLERDEASACFAAAYVLLRWNDQSAADKVMDAFAEAQGEQLVGLREALCQGPIEMVVDRLRDAYENGIPAVAAAAAEVFAVHGRLRANASRLTEFLSDDDPAVRRSAWRAVSMVDDTGGPP